jgi:hypothetical protein
MPDRFGQGLIASLKAQATLIKERGLGLVAESKVQHAAQVQDWGGNSAGIDTPQGLTITQARCAEFAWSDECPWIVLSRLGRKAEYRSGVGIANPLRIQFAVERNWGSGEARETGAPSLARKAPRSVGAPGGMAIGA